MSWKIWLICPASCALDICFTSTPPTSGLRLLEQDGHILRETDPNDRRKTLVRITPQGEQARLAGEQAISGYFSRVMARLTPEELAQMVALKDAFLAAIVAENDALEQDLANKKGDPAHDQDI